MEGTAGHQGLKDIAGDEERAFSVENFEAIGEMAKSLLKKVCTKVGKFKIVFILGKNNFAYNIHSCIFLDCLWLTSINGKAKTWNKTKTKKSIKCSPTHFATYVHTVHTVKT